MDCWSLKFSLLKDAISSSSELIILESEPSRFLIPDKSFLATSSSFSKASMVFLFLFSLKFKAILKSSFSFFN